jgi:hypothetical protein
MIVPSARRDARCPPCWRQSRANAAANAMHEVRMKSPGTSVVVDPGVAVPLARHGTMC